MGNLIGLTVAKFGIIAGLIVLLIVNKKGRKFLGVILAIAVIALAGPKILKEVQYYSYEAEIFAHENFTAEGRAEKRAEEARLKKQEEQKEKDKQDEMNRRIMTDKIFTDRGIKLWTKTEAEKEFAYLKDKYPARYISTHTLTDGFVYVTLRSMKGGEQWVLVPIRFWGDVEEAKTAVPLEFGTHVPSEMYQVPTNKYKSTLRFKD